MKFSGNTHICFILISYDKHYITYFAKKQANIAKFYKFLFSRVPYAYGDAYGDTFLKQLFAYGDTFLKQLFILLLKSPLFFLEIPKNSVFYILYHKLTIQIKYFLSYTNSSLFLNKSPKLFSSLLYICPYISIDNLNLY